MPRHGRAQAVGKQRAESHYSVRQTAQPASMLWLGDFGNKDLKCEDREKNKYESNLR